MKEVTIIGVDLAKNVFQLHGAAADGSVVFRKKLTRVQFHKFMSGHPACLVAMEACGSAHYWAREVAQMGHEPRLIAPRYAKPFAAAGFLSRSGALLAHRLCGYRKGLQGPFGLLLEEL